jgi:hypothetical protein
MYSKANLKIILCIYFSILHVNNYQLLFGCLLYCPNSFRRFPVIYGEDAADATWLITKFPEQSACISCILD